MCIWIKLALLVRGRNSAEKLSKIKSCVTTMMQRYEKLGYIAKNGLKTSIPSQGQMVILIQAMKMSIEVAVFSLKRVICKTFCQFSVV